MTTQTRPRSLPRARLTAQSSLTEEDVQHVNLCRRSYNRLGFAYQLVFVRLMNRFPQQQPFELIEEVLHFTAAQLDTDPGHITRYVQRQETISKHQAYIRRYLNLCRLEERELQLLEAFLFEECCQLEQTAALRAHAEQFLRGRRILQPAVTTLDRIIGEQRRQARQHIFERLAQSLPAQTITALDALLEVNEQTRTSALQALKEAPGWPSPAAIKRLIAKLERIASTGILNVDLSWLNNNYQRSLAKYTKRCSAHRLGAVEPAHRYAALACFLWQTYQDTIDQLVDAQDKLVTRIFSQAQSQFDEALRQQRYAIRRSISLLQTLARIVLDEGVADSDVRQTVFRRISKDELSSHVDQSREWLSGANSHVFYRVVRRYEYIRKFFPALLETLDFESQEQEQSDILDAISLLRQANQYSKRTLPPDTPIDLLPKRLQPLVQNNGVINKSAWECAILQCLRDEIKSGNLYVARSKRFGRFDLFFIPDGKWRARRGDFFHRAGLPVHRDEVQPYLTERLNRSYDDFLRHQSSNAYAAVDRSGWQLSSDPAEKLDAAAQERLDRLKQWLARHMRSIRLPELLIEVDNELNFTNRFLAPTHRGQRHPDEICSILVTIMAYGCNIGPYTMSRLTKGVSYRQIKRIADWQLTEETQRGALADVVRAMSSLGTARTWGEGRTSSSDGRRYIYRRSVLQQTFSHKMSDFALEFYSFVADNYAPFYSIPIECTDRDAAYVLDGLLYNESDLDLEEHYTDTHGYTEINFAAFAMLGRRFCPRIRGLQHQRIYRIDRNRDYGALTPLVDRPDRTIRLDWITEQWDRMGQFYASLESGHATASVALRRLASYSKKNNFYRANRELGRIFKTEFILQYMSQPLLRRRVRRGLLKGEQLHTLAKDVFYAKRGRVSARDVQEQMNTCSCLTLILACIIYWQAKEIELVIADCDPAAEGIDVRLLEHISPIEWDNVLLYGEYVIDRSLIVTA